MHCAWLHREFPLPQTLLFLLVLHFSTLPTSVTLLTLRVTHKEFLASGDGELLSWYLHNWPLEDAVQVARLIASNYYDWRRLWEARGEDEARQMQLLSLAKDIRLHFTIFSVEKLQRCTLWRAALLRPDQPYLGRLRRGNFNPKLFSFTQRQVLLKAMLAYYPKISEEGDDILKLFRDQAEKEMLAMSASSLSASASYNSLPSCSWQTLISAGLKFDEQLQTLALGWILLDYGYLSKLLLSCAKKAEDLRTFIGHLLPMLPTDLWPVQLIRILICKHRIGSSSIRLQRRLAFLLDLLKTAILENGTGNDNSNLRPILRWRASVEVDSCRRGIILKSSQLDLVCEILDNLRFLYKTKIVRSGESGSHSSTPSWEAPHVLATIVDMLSLYSEFPAGILLLPHLLWAIETEQALGVMERPLVQVIYRFSRRLLEGVTHEGLLASWEPRLAQHREQWFEQWQKETRLVATAKSRIIPNIPSGRRHPWPVAANLHYGLLSRFARRRVELNLLTREHQTLAPGFEPRTRVDYLLRDLVDFVYTTPGVLFDREGRWIEKRDWSTFVLLVRTLRWSLVHGWRLDMTPFPGRSSLDHYSLILVQGAFLDRFAPSPKSALNGTSRSASASSMAKVFHRELGEIVGQVGWPFLYDRLHQGSHM